MVGKTSISTRFIQGKFIKIDISNRTINTNCFQKRVQINDLIFNLNIWDTAGEEKYHAMAPMFYRGAQGAVVIFDVTKRETFNRATKWFDELRNFAEETKIILVGNKIDLPNREVSNEEAADLARKYKCSFLEVSALLGTNVNEIFNSLTESIYLAHKNKHKSEKNDLDDDFNNYNTNYGNNRSKKLKIGESPQNAGIANMRKEKNSCC